MRIKPHYLGLCHRDGCGEPAIWHVNVELRGTPLKCDTDVHVCEKHKNDASEFVLSDENRERLAKTLANENFCTLFIARGVVKHNAFVWFELMQ